MRESTIEARLVRGVEGRGGLCYKFVSPGNKGVPDRIVITPDGRTEYVELKSPTSRTGLSSRRMAARSMWN